jgi:hypothetical protein
VLGLNRWRRCSGIVLVMARSGSMSLTVSDLTSPLHRFDIYLRRRLQSVAQTFAVILHHIHIMISTSLASWLRNNGGPRLSITTSTGVSHNHCHAYLMLCSSISYVHVLTCQLSRITRSNRYSEQDRTLVVLGVMNVETGCAECGTNVGGVLRSYSLRSEGVATAESEG